MYIIGWLLHLQRVAPATTALADALRRARLLGDSEVFRLRAEVGGGGAAASGPTEQGRPMESKFSRSSAVAKMD